LWRSKRRWRWLRFNEHPLAVIKDDAEPVGNGPAKDRLVPKNRDEYFDWRKIADLKRAGIRGSNYSSSVSDSPDIIRVRRLAIEKPDRDDEVAGKTSIDKRVGVLSPVSKTDLDREVRKAGAAEKRFTHSHLPTAISPILKMKLPGPKVFVASFVTVKRSVPRSVLPPGDTAMYSPACSCSSGLPNCS